MSPDILPATSERFDDAEHAITGGGDGPTCQCQWWTMTASQFRETSREQKADAWRAEMSETPPPGLVAYVDGAPAGWVRVGPRTAQPRLTRTRLVTGSSPEPIDDPAVWAVSCFVVRKEYRRSGLMPQLLDAAVRHARDAGARVLEGYPFDLSARKRPSNELYRGVLSVFTDAGFAVIARSSADQALVSLTLRA
ncbi:GNAT family N-acetyltransferase [Microbacterium lushaniae]|nr:GNAT family N-acetyltransferase [Microbacterium lushaniae]KAA9146660.1 GNAT family N-acetyltransferase [Microbacterium lushaniae]